jgi:hypothetical protein
LEKYLEKDMTPILLEDLGMRYPTKNSKYKARYGLYQCQYCSKEFETGIQSVNKGATKSCGCQSNKYKNTHGLKYHKLYGTWSQMKARCYNPKHQYFKDYGGRGIKVCDRWLDINNFIEDMYSSYLEELTLDRIDVNGNYKPDNCRWATLDTQSRNTRDICSTNTSGFRGVYWHKRENKWVASIRINYKSIYLGGYQTALEAAKAYETYVRVNNLEHNFTSALTVGEIEEINKKEGNKCLKIL